MTSQSGIVIEGGTVVDGSGAPPILADVEIRGDKVVGVGSDVNRDGCTVIPANGLTVSPGFIDLHSHSDFLCLVRPSSDSRLHDGVTTEICGNCGSSAFPMYEGLRKRRQEEYADYGLTIDWEEAGEFFHRVEQQGSAINRGFLVGHGNIRGKIMGLEDREATEEEIDAMQALVRTALEKGALGFSSGLIYPPGCSATTDELVAMCKVVAELGGLYATHIRGESDNLLGAVEELIAIARRSGVRTQYAHIKTSGESNWEKIAHLKDLLENARKENIDICCDRYPYTASCTDLDVLLPDWAYAEGVEKELQLLQDPNSRSKLSHQVSLACRGKDFWSNVIVAATSRGSKEIEGKTIATLAHRRQQEPVNTLFDILIQERCRVEAIFAFMCEENLREFMAWPFVAIGSDSSVRAVDEPFVKKSVHPRSYGTFSRVLGKYVREEKILSVEEAVRKMTSLPASRVGLKNRGLLQAGYAADIVLFDAERITDTATYEEPHQYSKGIEYVIVNGCVALDNGRIVNVGAGQLLKASR